jgi:hypothetical protein
MLLSESLGVSPSQLWKYGVFDSYLGIDSLLHLNPAQFSDQREFPSFEAAINTSTSTLREFSI